MKLLLAFITFFQIISAITCPKMRELQTSDGATLAYTQAGPTDGQNIIFIAGWRQSAAEWRKQVDFFSKAGFRVTAYDQRGHGASPEPEFGYRVSRLAADLNELITELNLSDVTIVGHSMGVSTTWSFWDLFADSHSLISHLVLVDQPAQGVIDPTWPEGKAEERGAIFTPDSIYVAAADMENQLRDLVRGMFTESVSDEDYEWVVKENRKMSDKNSGALLINHAPADWSDVLPRIDVPTLVIGGESSIFSTTGIQWVADQIPGSKIYIFTAEEKGSHFMFWENPEKFNTLVRDFISA